MTQSRIQRRRRPVSSALDRIVVNEAHRVRRAMPPRAIEFEELIGYGYVGMVEAEQRYDDERGTNIETFARYRIRGAIIDGVRQALGVTRRRAYEHLRRRAASNLAVPTSTPTIADDVKEPLQSARRHTAEQPTGHVSVTMDTGVSEVPSTSLRSSHEEAVRFARAVLSADVRLRMAPSPEDITVHQSALRRLRRVLHELDADELSLIEAVYDFHGTDDSAARFARRRGLHRSSITRRHRNVLRKLRALMVPDEPEAESA
ncbi:MAG: sigma-70 family RNA polymerase sigma factor [Myxococcota bacterium]|nr:sigma-70 family RNA polymerase sigma factor [Myxococcota bacterium]